MNNSRTTEEIIELCTAIVFHCFSVLGHGLTGWILGRYEKLHKTSNVFIFTISAVLFVCGIINIFAILTFEFNHEIVGDIFCKTYWVSVTALDLFLGYTISAAFIIFLFRRKIHVRAGLVIIEVLLYYAMFGARKHASTIYMKTIDGENTCVRNGYTYDEYRDEYRHEYLDEYHKHRKFEAYANVLIMSGYLILKALQNCWDKLNIFIDKVNRLYLVLFISQFPKIITVFDLVQDYLAVIHYICHLSDCIMWMIFFFFDKDLNLEIRKILPCCKALKQPNVERAETEIEIMI